MVTDGSSAGPAPSLRAARFEVVPMRGVEEQLAHLPAGSTAAVTASPTRGLEATLELTRAVVARGVTAVPHVAARSVRDRSQLEDVLDELAALGVDDVFVPAGDAAEPAGAFHDALSLLRAMDELGRRPRHVGITGYPESHSAIDDATAIRAMAEKAPHATYIVSQICYDPAVTEHWVRAVRERGVDLPVLVGLPGVVDRVRLLRISARIGLGDSLRFVSKQSGVAGRLLAGYQPDAIVDGLARAVADPAAAIAGWHLFTFNEVERTVAWWRGRLGDAPA